MKNINLVDKERLKNFIKMYSRLNKNYDRFEQEAEEIKEEPNVFKSQIEIRKCGSQMVVSNRNVISDMLKSEKSEGGLIRKHEPSQGQGFNFGHFKSLRRSGS